MKRPIHLLILFLIALGSLQCAPKNQSLNSRHNPSDSSEANLRQERSEKILNNLKPVSMAAGYYHFLLGELSVLNADSESALRHFQFASQFYPSSDFIKLKEAEQLTSVGKVTEAKELLKSVQLKDEPDYFLLQARIASLELNFKSSEANLNEAIRIYEATNDRRKLRETVLMKVALLSDARMYDSAIQSLNAFIAENPEDEVAFYFLGKILSIQQKQQDSITAFQRSIELRPNFMAASKSLGLIYEINEDQDSAIRVYQDALFFNSSDSFLLQKLGNLFLIKEDYSKALDYFQQLVLSNPEDTQMLLRTALLHFKMEQFEEASALFTQLLENNDIAHDRIFFYLAASQERLGHGEQSVVTYRQVAKDSSYFVEARLQSAFIQRDQLNSTTDAILNLQEALQLSPDSLELVFALVNFYEKESQLELALSTIRRSLERDPENERLLFVLGSLLDRAGDFEESISVMRRVLKTNPNHAHALNHIGYLYAERGINFKEAEELLLKAVQLEPQNAYITDSLGWLYFKKGDFKKARDLLEKAVNLEPREPVILEHLADTYMKLGMEKQALDVYRQVVEISNQRLAEGDRSQEHSEQARRVQGKIASAVADSSF